MKNIFYSAEKEHVKIECFELSGEDIDPVNNDEYEVKCSNSRTQTSDSVTTNTPEGCIALANMVMEKLIAEEN